MIAPDVEANKQGSISVPSSAARALRKRCHHVGRPSAHLATLGVSMNSGCSIGRMPLRTDLALLALAPLAPLIDARSPPPPGAPPLPTDAAAAVRSMLSVTTVFTIASRGAKFW